jgi:hypothetical protein
MKNQRKNPLDSGPPNPGPLSRAVRDHPHPTSSWLKVVTNRGPGLGGRRFRVKNNINEEVGI